MGFTGSSVIKNLAANAGAVSLILVKLLLPGKIMDKRSLARPMSSCGNKTVGYDLVTKTTTKTTRFSLQFVIIWYSFLPESSIYVSTLEGIVRSEEKKTLRKLDKDSFFNIYQSLLIFSV